MKIITNVKMLRVLFCFGLLALVFSQPELLPRKTFRCDNGKYLADSAFCNSYDNCRDGSDESIGCDWIHCEPEHFKCSLTRDCFNMSVRCNTIMDCSDNSDEEFCGDEVNVHNCSLSDGKFLCNDGLRCLDLEYTCDGSCNCFDCSDENVTCNKFDYDLLRECPHSYFPTPNGPICMCNSKNNELEKLCKKLENCTDQNICQQRCSKYKDKVQCSCYNDYVEVAGTKGFKCRSKVYFHNSLAYATSSQIKILNLTKNEVSVVKTNVECATLTAAHDDLYYTTYYDGAKSIFKTSITSKTTVEIVKSDFAITSVAVDYITNNTYFTTNESLSVCSADGKICTQLKCCNVTYVALAPKFGWMFFTMKSNFQNERFIVKSNMDGSNEQLVIDGTFRYPVPLAVEESIEKLYWLEIIENIIHSVSFTGVANEFQFVKFYGTVTSFTALGSVFYYTKSRDNQIYSVENIERFTKTLKNSTWLPMLFPLVVSSSHGELQIPIDFLSELNATRIYDNNLTMAIRNVYAFNPSIQNGKTVKNPCEKSPCSGLCLLRSSPSMNQLNHTCACNDFISTGTQNWCKISSKTSEFDFSPKQDAVTLQDQTQKSSTSLIFVTILVIVVMVLVILVFYSGFRRGNCHGYFDTIRNCINKPNDRMNIYNGEDL